MAALDDYIRSFTPKQDVFGAFNEAYGFQNAIQQQRNAMARQQQADAMRQQEFGMRRQEYEARIAEQQRQQAQQERLQNAMSLASQGRQVSVPWDEVMAGPSFGEQDITAQVPYSYEEQVGMLAPYLGADKFLEMRKPQEIDYDIKEGPGGEYIHIPKRPGAAPVPTGIRSPEKKPLVDMRGANFGPGGSPNNLYDKLADKMAERNATTAGDIFDQAAIGAERRSGIQLQRATIAQGLETGAFAPLVNGVASYVEGFGIDPKTLNLPDPSKGQVFDMATFDNLLKALQAQKGPQTEGDAQRALKTFASIKNTKEANLFILDYMEALTYRQEELAQFVQDNVYRPEHAKDPNVVNNLRSKWIRTMRDVPIVAASKQSGLPITFYKYREAGLQKGMTEEEVLSNWKAFSK